MKKRLLSVWMIIFISMPFLVFSQTRQITGVVKNSRGEAVASASILEKGTTNGVSADENGRFKITVNNNAVLVISSAEFEATEIKVGNASSYDVVLQESSTMDAVVVTALGITRKERSLGYSTQEVKGENLTLTKEQNVLGSLAGKIAGVQVVGSSGASMWNTKN